MLNHLLAGFVGLGGLSLFLSGFFFPEVRRKPDFAWSGVALLYALVLWIEGDGTSGGALLGHIFSVTLIAWFGWQTLQQRQQLAALEERTLIPSSLETLTPFLKAGWEQMTVAYGKAADWIQTQTSSGDTSIAPESLTAHSQEDTLEDAWGDNMPTVSSNSPEPGVAEDTPEHLDTELIAPSESETQVETPQTAELQQNLLHPEPEALNDVPLQGASPASPVGEENSPPAETDNAAEVTPETRHDIPGEEMVAESKSTPLEEAQDISNEESMHEDASHNPTLEYDDGSWPPKDPIT